MIHPPPLCVWCGGREPPTRPTQLVAHPSNPAPPPLPQEKYKGIAVALNVLTCALSGNYVNFGVFALYEDPVGGWVGAFVRACARLLVNGCMCLFVGGIKRGSPPARQIG